MRSKMRDASYSAHRHVRPIVRAIPRYSAACVKRSRGSRPWSRKRISSSGPIATSSGYQGRRGGLSIMKTNTSTVEARIGDDALAADRRRGTGPNSRANSAQEQCTS